MNFSKGEEDLMELQVKTIADSGANVIVTGGKIADMALHYANKYKLMVVRWERKIPPFFVQLDSAFLAF